MNNRYLFTLLLLLILACSSAQAQNGRASQSERYYETRIARMRLRRPVKAMGLETGTDNGGAIVIRRSPHAVLVTVSIGLSNKFVNTHFYADGSKLAFVLQKSQNIPIPDIVYPLKTRTLKQIRIDAAFRRNHRKEYDSIVHDYRLAYGLLHSSSKEPVELPLTWL